MFVTKKLTETPIIVFDVETTGLDTSTVRVVEFGAAIYENSDAEVVRRRALINPGVPIPEEAARVHRIDDERVRDCEDFKALWPRIHGHFDGRLACGYNVLRYDQPVIDAEIKRHGLTQFPLTGPFLDVIVFVNWHLRGTRGRNLENMAKLHGVEPAGGRAHSAAVDCQMTGELLWALIAKGLIPDDVDEALEQQSRYKQVIDGEYERWGVMIYRDRETGRMRMGVGKHAGALLEEVPNGWLSFALRKFEDLKPEAKLAFQRAKAGKLEDEFNEALPGMEAQAEVVQKKRKNEWEVER